MTGHITRLITCGNARKVSVDPSKFDLNKVDLYKVELNKVDPSKVAPGPGKVAPIFMIGPFMKIRVCDWTYY